MDNIIKYGSRTFGEFKNDMFDYIAQTYPEILSDFSDSSVGTMLVDINAGVANNLSMTTDRVFQETQLEYAQQRASILNIAKNMGFNIPPKRPSVTVVDLTVTVPVLGDSPDASYYPILLPGAQITGGGKTFETLDVIDWSSPSSSFGYSNRKIIPNLNSNGIIMSYNITKKEIITNGRTSIYRRIINDDDVIPFLSITLPDSDVLEIQSVILMEGSGLTLTPTESDYNNPSYRYYEVDYLAQQRVFVEKTENSRVDENTGVKAGKWFDVSRKFIKEFTENGFCKLTFGSGDVDIDAFRSGFLKQDVDNKYFLENFLNNTALGVKLKSGYTLFVKYRTGGGSSSNLGKDVLNQMGQHVINCNGSRQDYVQNVKKSIKVTNVIPAIGGNDGLDNEQIRQLIKYNFSAQMRDVTLNDYLLQIYKMPGKFGSPYRVTTYKLNNKVMISILNIGSDGKLSNTSSSILKDNISEYLSQYKLINDFGEIKDGKIINLGFEIDVYVDNISNNQIANSIINLVKSYFDIKNHNMNEDIFIGALNNQILQANGVINIISIKIFNKVGNGYSNNYTSQELVNLTTGEIKLINNTIYSDNDSMFEIKYPERDIKVFLRKNNY
jgi:hypothetical protein